MDRQPQEDVGQYTAVNSFRNEFALSRSLKLELYAS